MKKIIKTIQHVFFFVCILFLIKYIHESKDELINITSNAKILYLFISFILWSILVFFIPWFSHTIVTHYKKNITFSDIITSYIDRLPAKYLPGGIWHTVARLHYLSKKGMTKKEISILVFYENIWSVLTTSIVGGFGVYFYHRDSYWGTIALIIFFIAITIIPTIFMLRKKTYILSFNSYIKISMINLSFWFIASISFLCYLSAFSIFELEIAHIFSYMFSWLIGFISIFTPQGIGVFELTMAQLTPFSVSLDESMIIIAGFRLIIFISDLINWLVYWVYKNLIHHS